MHFWESGLCNWYDCLGWSLKYWLEPETVCGGDSLSKLLRKRVIIPVPILLCALHNCISDFSRLLNTFNLLWNNCLQNILESLYLTLDSLSFKEVFVLLFGWVPLQCLLHIFRYVFILSLQLPLNLWYLDLGKWLASTAQKATSLCCIHQQTLFVGV